MLGSARQVVGASTVVGGFRDMHNGRMQMDLVYDDGNPACMASKSRSHACPSASRGRRGPPVCTTRATRVSVV